MACPVDRCPDILRNNSQCDPRCNIQLCDFDDGDCNNNNNDDGVEAPFGELGGVIEGIFFGVLGIVGVIILVAVVRSAGLSYNSYLGMSPYDRIQVALGIRTREEITGENNDATEDEEEANNGSVAEANAVREANPLSSQFEVEEGVERLPVADAASEASSRLPEAREFGSDEGEPEEDEEEVQVEIADENEVPMPDEIVVRRFDTEDL